MGGGCGVGRRGRHAIGGRGAEQEPIGVEQGRHACISGARPGPARGGDAADRPAVRRRSQESGQPVSPESWRGTAQALIRTGPGEEGHAPRLVLRLPRVPDGDEVLGRQRAGPVDRSLIQPQSFFFARLRRAAPPSADATGRPARAPAAPPAQESRGPDRPFAGPAGTPRRRGCT